MNISVGILLTSSFLLAVMLLVWAQLWVNTYKLYKDREKRGNTTMNENIDSSANLALTWTYGALLFTIIAIACIALSVWGGETWKKLGISALGVSFSMLIVEVLISFLCAGFKFWNNKEFDEPCCLILDKRLSRYLLIGLPVWFSIFSLCSVFYRNYWLLFVNLAIIIVTGVIIWRVFPGENDQSSNTK